MQNSMEVSVEVTFVKAFMEASGEVASVEVNFLEASTENLRGSFHGMEV